MKVDADNVKPLPRGSRASVKFGRNFTTGVDSSVFPTRFKVRKTAAGMYLPSCSFCKLFKEKKNDNIIAYGINAQEMTKSLSIIGRYWIEEKNNRLLPARDVSRRLFHRLLVGPR